MEVISNCPTVEFGSVVFCIYISDTFFVEGIRKRYIFYIIDLWFFLFFPFGFFVFLVSFLDL